MVYYSSEATKQYFSLSGYFMNTNRNTQLCNCSLYYPPKPISEADIRNRGRHADVSWNRRHSFKNLLSLTHSTV